MARTSYCSERERHAEPRSRFGSITVPSIYSSARTANLISLRTLPGTMAYDDHRVPVRQCPPILPGATLPVLRWRVTPPGTHEIPRPIPVREGVVSKNTNELKTCISQSVSYRRVYACFAKGSWNAWS